VALALPVGDEPHVAPQQLGHRTLAAGATEDEGDRRQQSVAVQLADHLGARGRAAEAPSPALAAPAPVALPAASSVPAAAATPLEALPGLAHPGPDRVEQLRVDPGRVVGATCL